MTVDPVCGMDIPPTDDDLTTEYEGNTYRFCSETCKASFEDNPTDFLETPHPHLMTSSTAGTQRLPYGRASGTFEHDITDPTDLQQGDRVTFSKEIGEGDVRKFAEATGDTNALHLNEGFASRTRFGRRIVHGTLVSGLISAALACFPGLTIYLSQSLSFNRPVDIDTTLTATCEITEVLDDDRYELSTIVTTDDAEPVIEGTARVLIDPLPT